MMKISRKFTGKKPKVMILSGYGLNCEDETKFAFDEAGGVADIVHINDLIRDPSTLGGYQILVFPGGFSYGDDTGSGKAFANKFKNHLSHEVAEFLARDTLVLGICNGFQIIANLGIVPGALTHNKNARYIDRWVDLKVVGRSPWLKNVKSISLPIAHGEGRYVAGKGEYNKLKKDGGVGLVYTRGQICDFQSLEKNPNGSEHDIAGVLSYNGRVLGLMPHPERGMFAHQSPLWHSGDKKVREGEGMIIFRNAINYFRA